MQSPVPASKPGLIAIFGSGEASPSSAIVYDWVMSRTPPPIQMSILETPAGFEPNSAHVAERVAEGVRARLTRYAPQITVVPARRRGSAFSPDDGSIVAPLFQSNIMLLGPGSPTYAVRQLRGSLAWQALLARHRLGAAIVLASAGAIAASAQALPVYEIYKAGEDLHWQPGLDLFGAYGLKLAIIPHWNNTDGGADLDTSHAFLGQDRYRKMRDMLPRETVVLGIDELTALVVDIEAETCRVLGQGGVTLATGAQERRFEAGEDWPLGALGRLQRIDPESGLPAEVWQQALAGQHPPEPNPPTDPSLWAIVREREVLRSRGDWAGADQLRNQLAAMGWRVLDTSRGPRLSRN